MSTVGCYVIGEDVIHLSPPILESQSYAPEGCVTYFVAACKKLPKKLECLVIVDPESAELKTLKELFTVAQEYANVVYIIPAIVALLQYTVSTIRNFIFDRILILMKSSDLYYVCDLVKENNLIFPLTIKTENMKSLFPYSGFQEVHCFYQNAMGKTVRKNLNEHFPNINLLKLLPPMITLAIGGFLKALCIVNPGINLEVLNFTPGIYNGNISIVNRCARFPLQAEYVQMSGIPTSFRDILTLTSGIKKKAWKIKEVENIFPAQSVFKNYIIDYNIFGLLSIKSPASQLSFNIFNDFLHNLNKVHIWSIEKQTRAIFDMVQKQRHFELFDNNVKNLFSDEWLNFVNQTTQFSTQGSDSDLHTIFIDKKIDNYIYGPRISIAPSYIGILQYYITYSKPTTPNLIALLITKRSSKLYAMIERSPLCYTVTYISDYYENQILFDSNFVKKKTKILYIHEKGMNQTLQLNFLSTNISVTRLEISNLEEVMFYGGAIYALQNSNTTLTSPYVTIDPLFDPEENNIEGTSTVSRRTSTCFYEIEAFFHGALKSINSALFYGDLIAIILQRKKNVHIYFFIHVKNKFLFKNDITISTYETVDASLLHFADYILVDSDYPKLLKFAENLPLNCFKWDKTVGVNEFLKDMKEQKLLIYENSNYSESILAAKNYKILQNVIFEKTSMTIEYQAEKCRILLKNDQCIALQNEEWIPMYVSFLKTLPIVGKEAGSDLEKSPESVIYDFLTLIGSTSKTITFDPKWKFQLVEMDESDDPKIGYKVKTSEGYKIISPEMALTIYLQKLININEKHFGKNVDEIRIRLMDTVLTKIQKEAFENAAKRLKKSILFC